MTQQRNSTADATTGFNRVCAVLCLFLLMFSVAHTVVGHAGPSLSAATSSSVVFDQHLLPAGPDAPDACALCAAMTTAVVLAVLVLGVPRTAKPCARPSQHVPAVLSGWHISLFCRPPPLA